MINILLLGQNIQYLPIMAGKTWQQAMAGRVAPIPRKQRDINGSTQLTFSSLFTSEPSYMEWQVVSQVCSATLIRRSGWGRSRNKF